jgi:SPP1 family predicted phage head-tail adaptor
MGSIRALLRDYSRTSDNMGGYTELCNDLAYIYGEHITNVSEQDLPYSDKELNVTSIFYTDYYSFIYKDQDLIIDGYRYRIKHVEDINSMHQKYNLYLEAIK